MTLNIHPFHVMELCVSTHGGGVIHGDLKGVFDFMMDNNNLYYNFTP